ncbi:RloB family protein [Aquimarina sp. 2-A2]|uniref:RloB family protein n=1 Tax=Aquimarina sp. 2-A2 TaxID=3382644 RepID=UPI00387F1519
MAKKKHQKESFSDFLKQLKEDSINEAKPVDKIKEREYFLIVCEGERTEPEYFNYFKDLLPRQLLETIEITGEGDNTINIVKKAIKLKEEREANILLPNFDEVWAVYDKDDFPTDRFHEAIRLASQNNVNSGHSNQSFELWYVLHFQFLQNALHRSDYIKILSKNLGFKYQKNDISVVKYLFDNCNVAQAIKWAEQLEELHVDNSEAMSCPSTKVYKLVQKLLEYTEHDS